EQGLATNLTPGYCWSTSFKVLRVLFLGEIYSGFCLQRRHVGRTNFATWGLANSIRPLNRHSPSCPLTPPLRGQKPAPDTLCTKPPRHSPAVPVPPPPVGSRLRNMAPFRQELPVSLWRREYPWQQSLTPCLSTWPLVLAAHAQDESTPPRPRQVSHHAGHWVGQPGIRARGDGASQGHRGCGRLVASGTLQERGRYGEPTSACMLESHPQCTGCPRRTRVGGVRRRAVLCLAGHLARGRRAARRTWQEPAHG